MSVGHALHMGERYKNRALIWPTLYRSFVFLMLLLVLSAMEEIITGIIHRQTLTESISNFGGGTLDQLVATSIVVLLILIPFFAFRTLGEIVGEDNLVRVFFSRPCLTRRRLSHILTCGADRLGSTRRDARPPAEREHRAACRHRA